MLDNETANKKSVHNLLKGRGVERCHISQNLWFSPVFCAIFQTVEGKDSVLSCLKLNLMWWESSTVLLIFHCRVVKGLGGGMWGGKMICYLSDCINISGEY